MINVTGGYYIIPPSSTGTGGTATILWASGGTVTTVPAGSSYQLSAVTILNYSGGTVFSGIEQGQTRTLNPSLVLNSSGGTLAQLAPDGTYVVDATGGTASVIVTVNNTEDDTLTAITTSQDVTYVVPESTVVLIGRANGYTAGTATVAANVVENVIVPDLFVVNPDGQSELLQYSGSVYPNFITTGTSSIENSVGQSIAEVIISATSNVTTTVGDSLIQSSGGTYQVNVPATSGHVIPNVIIINENGDLKATVQAAQTYEIPDYNLVNSQGVGVGGGFYPIDELIPVPDFSIINSDGQSATTVVYSGNVFTNFVFDPVISNVFNEAGTLLNSGSTGAGGTYSFTVQDITIANNSPKQLFQINSGINVFFLPNIEWVNTNSDDISDYLPVFYDDDGMVAPDVTVTNLNTSESLSTPLSGTVYLDFSSATSNILIDNTANQVLVTTSLEGGTPLVYEVPDSLIQNSDGSLQFSLPATSGFTIEDITIINPDGQSISPVVYSGTVYTDFTATTSTVTINNTDDETITAITTSTDVTYIVPASVINLVNSNATYTAATFNEIHAAASDNLIIPNFDIVNVDGQSALTNIYSATVHTNFTQEGIAYNRDQYGGVRTSYALGDVASQFTAGTYNYFPTGQTIQALDWNDSDPFYRVRYDNIFGNRFRFTTDDGTPPINGLAVFSADTFSSSTKWYVIDHLTGLGWLVANQGEVDWNEALTAATALNYSGYTDWRLPSLEEFSDVISKEDLIDGDRNIFRQDVESGFEALYVWMGQTDVTNSANAIIYFNNVFAFIGIGKISPNATFYPVRTHADFLTADTQTTAYVIVENSEGQWIATDSITAGSTATTVIADSVIQNSAAQTISSLPATSGLTVGDSLIQNTAAQVISSLPAQSGLTVPDSIIENSLNQKLIELPATSSYTVSDSVVQNSDGSYLVNIPATSSHTIADTVLLNTSGGTISGTDIKAGVDATILDYRLQNTNTEVIWTRPIPPDRLVTVADVTVNNPDGQTQTIPYSGNVFTNFITTGTSQINNTAAQSLTSVTVNANSTQVTEIGDSLIQNTAAETISSLPATSGLTVPDSLIQNSDASIQVNLPATSAFTIADLSVINSDGQSASSIVYSGTVYTDFEAGDTVPESAITISYHRPFWTGQEDIFLTGDTGWHFQNGTYDYNTTGNTLQELNHGTPNSFYRLRYNNVFGNKFRFTTDNGDSAGDGLAQFGTTAFSSSTTNYIIDHLTGLAWFRIKIGYNQTWDEAILSANSFSWSGISDWRVPSIGEMISVFNNEDIFFNAGNIFVRSSEIASGNETRVWLGNTHDTNTTQAHILNDSGDISRNTKSSPFFNATYICRTHYQDYTGTTDFTAFFVAENSEGQTLTATTAEPANTGFTVIADSVVQNSAAQTISSLPATSGLTVGDSLVQNSDASYQVNVPATSGLTLGDVTVNNPDGQTQSFPYSGDVFTNFITTGASQINNTAAQSLTSVTINANSTQVTVINDSLVQNSDGSYQVSVPATSGLTIADTLLLNTTGGTIDGTVVRAGVDATILNYRLGNSNGDSIWIRPLPPNRIVVAQDVTVNNPDGQTQTLPYSGDVFTNFITTGTSQINNTAAQSLTAVTVNANSTQVTVINDSLVQNSAAQTISSLPATSGLTVGDSLIQNSAAQTISSLPATSGLTVGDSLIQNTAAQTISSLPAQSGLTIGDSLIENSDSSIQVNVPAQSGYTIPNIDIINSDGQSASSIVYSGTVYTSFSGGGGGGGGDIAYQRPRTTFPATQSVTIGDAAYQLLTAGTYNWVQPSTISHLAAIDHTANEGDIRVSFNGNNGDGSDLIAPTYLQENNEFGNKYRFTDSIGNPSDSSAGSLWDHIDWVDHSFTGAEDNYVIDHLTGLGWWIDYIFSGATSLNSLEDYTWNQWCAYIHNEFSGGSFTDWRLPTFADYNSVDATIGNSAGATINASNANGTWALERFFKNHFSGRALRPTSNTTGSAALAFWDDGNTIAMSFTSFGTSTSFQFRISTFHACRNHY